MSEASKRRSAHTSATPPPKASRMSAAAPVFNPAKPLVPKADDLDAESSANAAAVAAAVAKSRVTRPLPNSRRQAPGADFVPKQATVPKSVEQKENTRRLIVVLSQVSRTIVPIGGSTRPRVAGKTTWSMSQSRSEQCEDLLGLDLVKVGDWTWVKQEIYTECS